MGFIAVEFFFILSGYFLVSSLRKKDWDLIPFLIHKIKSFFSYFVVAELLLSIWMFAVNYFVYHLDIIMSIYNSLMFIASILFISVDMPFSWGVEWYLGGMLIGIIVLFPLIKKYGRNFTLVYAPMIAALIMAWIWFDRETLDRPDLWFFFVKQAVLRSIAIMCIGAFTFECASSVKNIRFNNSGTIIISLTTIISFIYIFINIIFYTKINSGISRPAYEFLIIVFMILGTTLLMSEKTKLNIYATSDFKHKLSLLLGTGSIVLYLNHFYYIYTLKNIHPNMNADELGIICIITIIIISITCFYLSKYLSKYITKLFIDNKTTIS